MKSARTALLVLLFVSAAATAGAPPVDPLNSSQWEHMHELYLKDHAVVFDERVQVVAPEAAEDSLQVPVFVDASRLQDVRKIIVFVDYNPLPKVLEYEPLDAAARLGFRIKLQQASPVRAAVLTGDGTWHVGGQWIDAAGGGCTLPSFASSDPVWATKLGEVSGRLWQRSDETQRLRFSVIHPMDTGLAAGIPVFIVESIDIRNERGDPLAILRPLEPISEDPIFSLDVNNAGGLHLDGRDNNGNRFRAQLDQ